MEVLNNIVNNYNEQNQLLSNSDNNTELEITFHLLKNKDLYTNIFNKLKSLSSSIVIHEYIDAPLQELLRRRTLARTNTK